MPAVVSGNRADLPAAMATSQVPSFAVAVWSTKSPFTHSIVSPTFAVTSAGENARSFIVTCTTSPAVDGAVSRTHRVQQRPVDAASRAFASRLVELAGEVLGVLLVALEYLEARLQQALQFAVRARKME